jgi:hypothetical protein
LTLAAFVVLGAALAQAPAAVPARPATVPELAARLQAAWSARDLNAYLALFAFPDEADRVAELEAVAPHFAAAVSQLEVQPSVGSEPRARVAAQAFSSTEPRARVEQWVYLLERGPDGWVAAGREARGRIEGLVHLSIDPQAYRADGLTLRLEDFELAMTRGTIFTTPSELGPTAMVFVGDAQVRIRPRPEAERDQLVQFAGRPELVEPVRAAFVRIHPADLHRVLVPARLTPDPGASPRLAAARRFWDEQASRSFLLDANLPGSPWWLLPGLGDASVSFHTRRGTLTFTVSTSEPETISLFDRQRRRQILLYPTAGGSTDYNEDDGREFDLLHHDLSVRFDPARRALEGEDTLRLRVLAAAPTIRLRLDESLRVHSIRSPQGGEHLFFRVRGQDSVMVSLGALAGYIDEFALTVRYGGVHAPEPVEQEVIQAGSLSEDEFQIEDVLVYTNRTVWYPRGGLDDYALATLRFEVPAGHTVVAGGERVRARTEAGRTRVEYRQDQPGKYISVAVGRLQEIGERSEGSVALRAFAVPRARNEGVRMLDAAGGILRFYEREFGPCPYPRLNLALIESATPGGHSPPGMVLLAQRPVLLRRSLRDDPANFTDVPGFFLAHELAHQWWGHGVAGQNYRERWLSEGLAQYAAALWVRHHLGERPFQDVLERMARWALRAADKGPIHLGHRLGHVKGDPQIYRAVVYDKGAYVLHMLRGVVGEDAFRRALSDFQARHRYGKAGTSDLRAALERASGLELAAYFEAWVRGTEIPSLEYGWHVEPVAGSYRTTVEVTARGLPGPVPLRIDLEASGLEPRTVILPTEGGSWTFDTAARPRGLWINGDRGLLARVRRR